MSIEIQPDELAIIDRIADWLAPRHPFVERGDLVSHMALWMLEHEEAVLGLREKGQGLHTTLRREAQRYVGKERAAIYGYHPGDQFRYPLGLLRELLLEAVSLGWASPSGLRDSTGSSGQDPAHSGGRIAMLIDVRAALRALPRPLQVRVVEAASLRFDEGALAELWTTEDKPVSVGAATSRVRYALKRMVDILVELRADVEYTGSRKVGAQRSPWTEGGILS